MSRRIDIELTSARPDGTWTWRAAGAREPKGVLEGAILPEGAKAGDVLKVDAEFEVEGITVLGVASLAKSRKEPTRLEIIPTERSFEPVTQTLAKRERTDRPRRDGDRERPRRDGDRDRRPAGRPDGDRRPGARPEGGPGRGPRPEGGDKRGGERRDRPARPRFEPVPELPQRPRPKRLKPGKVHRTAVLADLPEAQRAIAEKALSGGIPAVRQAVQDQNATLRAQGKEEVPAAGLLKMAEELLPRLRVAEWLDRADAAKADLAELDLRDLRSVVAAGEDPAVSRDETTRALAAELKAALASKQEKASAEWLEDIQLALGVGRVIRALKLSAEPPKAGMRFPAELGTQLVAAAVGALAADATPDRWSAVLEAVAFSPVRAQVTPAAAPTQTSDELTATVTRLAPLVPQVATLFGITVAPGSSAPKPLRPTRSKPERKPGAPGGRPGGGPRPGPPPGPKADRAATTEPTADRPAASASTPLVTVDPTDAEAPPAAPVEAPAADPAIAPAAATDALETPIAETPAAETPAAEPSAAEPSTAETPTAETPTAETPTAEPSAVETPTPEVDTAPPIAAADAPETPAAETPAAEVDAGPPAAAEADAPEGPAAGT